jgi:hypothetical protein
MTILTKINDHLLYAIRQETDGQWALLNRRYAILETVSSFDLTTTRGLFTKANDQTGGPEVWLYGDANIPYRSTENLARYEAVLGQVFSGNLPHCASTALVKAAAAKHRWDARR